MQGRNADLDITFYFLYQHLRLKYLPVCYESMNTPDTLHSQKSFHYFTNIWLDRRKYDLVHMHINVWEFDLNIKVYMGIQHLKFLPLCITNSPCMAKSLHCPIQLLVS